jgi:serine-type D-Ala-D-Ala carboxypeptidase (penicillin-binding protein 5/6)
VPRTSQRLALTLLAGASALILAAPVLAAPTAAGAAPAGPLVATEPIATEPIATEPIATGPTATGPTATGPAAPGQARSEPVGGPLLAGRGVLVPRGAPRLPAGISGRAWIVADLDTGAVLGARDPHGRYLPASTLKTLTALTLLPRLVNRKRVVYASAADCNVDGTRVGLIPGGHYPVEMLFQCLLMKSGNDCAGALAEANGGVPETVAQMNAVARRLHATDTHAATPSGLDGPGQSTSAYDLALIMRQALAIPDFRRYNTTLISSVPPQSSKYGRFQFANDNKLLYNVPGVLAAKNGFTDAARHTFVAAVARGNRRIVVAMLHGEQRPVPVWQQVSQLVEWGVRVPAGASLGRLVEPTDPASQPPHPAVAPSAGSSAGSAAGPGGAIRAAGGGDHGLPLLPVVLAAAGIAVAIAVVLALLAWRSRRPRSYYRSTAASRAAAAERARRAAAARRPRGPARRP